MVTKFNFLFFLFMFSIILFINSLHFKESKLMNSQNEDLQADKEASNEINFGMAQDWDRESISEIQLQDTFTEISDNNTNFLEEPNEEKTVIKNSEDKDKQNY